MVALRIAWRDATHHRLRTLLSVLLIAFPLIAGVSLGIALATREDTASAARRSLPEGVGAVIETYPLPPSQLPLKQPYHGAALVASDPYAKSAEAEQVQAIVGSEVEEVFEASNLLVHSGERFIAANLTEANAAMKVVNADADTLLPVPAPSSAGSKQADTSETGVQTTAGPAGEVLAEASTTPVVITQVVAEQLQLGTGDEMQVVSVNEVKVSEVVGANFRVIGVIPGMQAQIYSRFAHLQQVRAGKPGVERLFYTAAGVSWHEVKELNQIGALVVSKEVLDNPPRADELYPADVPAEQVMLYAASVGVGGGVSLLLALFLLTPAFTVSAEQFTRSLALLSVVGAEPKQLRRIMATQGIVIGTLAGTLGAVFGTALGLLLLWLRLQAVADELGITGPSVNMGYNLRFVPWLLAPGALIMGLLSGYSAAYLPAHWAAKQNLLLSLSGRGHPQRQSPRLRLSLALVILAGISWGLLFALPRILPSGGSEGITYAVFATLAAIATVLNVLALLSILPLIFGLLQYLPLPLVWKMASRDAYQHRRRSIPTAAAVAVMVLVVSAALTISATAKSNERDLRIVSRGENAILIAPRVYSQWDDSLLKQGVDALELPVKKVVPVMNIERAWLKLNPRQACPTGSYVSIEARLDPAQPIRCVRYDAPRYSSTTVESVPGVLVMDAEALAASELPVSPKILHEGGIIVGDASTLDAGKAHVTVLDEGGKPQRTTQIAAAFSANVATIVSPQAASELGLPPSHQIGWFLVFDEPVTAEEFERAWQQLGVLSALLVHDGPGTGKPTSFEPTLTVTASVFMVLILWLALALARTTMRADIATMNAVGAPPSIARRYSAAQGLMVALASVPLGSLGGILVAYAVINISRAFPLESGGPFRLFVVPPSVFLVAIGAVALAVILGWLSGGTKVAVSTRRIE